MSVVHFKNLIAGLALAVAVLGVGAAAQAQDRTIEARIVEADAPVGAAVDLVLDGGDDKAAPAEEGDINQERHFNIRVAPPADAGYWIGMQLEPPSGALRSQLGVAENQGLVIAELFPDTPAVKAGFAKHDLLLKVGDDAVSDVEAFNKQVQESKGEKELALTLMRGGKQLEIHVTPAKRPSENSFSIQLTPGADQEDVLQYWIPKGLDLNEGPVHVELFHPGVIVEREIQASEVDNLPKDVSISISKSGDKPAEISVKKGHIKWDVTEKELDKLPADVRPHVERMLGRGTRRTDARVRMLPRTLNPPPMIVTPYRPAPSSPVLPPAVAPQAIPASPDIQHQLDEVNKRLEDLQKALDSLVKARSDAESGDPDK
ncbi:MAG: PDZ domain-containing protein [Pirellulales bacterium]